MKCKDCPAYGIDNIGFYGCLIRHTMQGRTNNSFCKLNIETIRKRIEITKRTESRANHYKWVNEQVGEHK